jgi:tetratricopeptide (TPR) repeat protein
MLRRIFPLVFLLAASAANGASAWEPWAAPQPPPSAPEDVKTAVKDADGFYRTRQESGNIEKCLAVLRPAAAAHPESYDIQWRLARALFWLSESQKESETHRALAEEGAHAGDRAVAAKPEGTEGLYFGALCVGEIAHSVGVLTALTMGLEGRFREPMLKVEKLNPGIDNGGLYNGLGRYKYELPWPKRDLDASVKYLRHAIELTPADLRARVFLAETLAKRDNAGDKEEGRRLLKFVFDATPGQYDTAEEIRAQSLGHAAAKRLGWDI